MNKLILVAIIGACVAISAAAAAYVVDDGYNNYPARQGVDLRENLNININDDRRHRHYDDDDDDDDDRRKKRAIVEETVMVQDAFGNIVPQTILVDENPLGLGKRAIIEEDVKRTDAFGNTVEQRVVEDTNAIVDPLMRLKRQPIVDPLMMPGQTVYQRDALGNLIPITTPVMDPLLRGKRAIVDPLMMPGQTIYQRDALGNLIPINTPIVDPLLRGKRAIVEETVMIQDAFGNIVPQNILVDENPLGLGKRDVVEETIKTTDALGNTVQETIIEPTSGLLDGLFRRKRAIVQSPMLPGQVVYQRDALGNLVPITNPLLL